ncbi:MULTISPECIES: hypothetical protein [unclassified Paenibacillus]|uniref:hypothetical protein n=1 Tax=unclassified Paenibacillus TaxID=185978 RepID=UPI0009A83625|nr:MULTISPECIES: hypothetical protein [unclassified Paenibacillus]SLJ94561.1 hypothetical protein SAMN06272722_1024 [Paenibacillus sp. RU5A]SOC67509.1 hypothetical protein SAMN05880581_102994 [Paenibacillus sp. RU26A]SOC68922.1 hypothetical protein SAMN05880586_1024 [Paenibacillus sp. RU5M]
MNKAKKERLRRALRAQLKQTYINLMDTEDVHKQADYRLKSLRLQKLLKKVDNARDDREYVTGKHIVGHCLNCEVAVSAYNEDRVEDKGSMFCSQGCQAHYEELAGHKKAAASRERNRLSEHFFNSINVILPNTQRQIKLG